MAKETEKDGPPVDVEEIAAEEKISNFARKIGEETSNKFTVYIYRSVKDEESGRTKKPFVKKYIGIEPDPQEIADKFRGGSYYVQFIWYIKGKQQSKNFTLDIDEDAFPPLPKQQPNALIPIPGAMSNMNEAMQMQYMTLNAVADVMKSAYASGNAGIAKAQQDPMEMFSGVLEAMENSFSRAMSINNQVMERVYLRNMEKKYGLGEESSLPALPAPEDESGLVGKYAPIVKDIVDGLKTVIGLFGEVPKKVVDKVKTDDRFKSLLKDPKALVVIGQALRREFGDIRAASMMESFGVRMVMKNGQAVTQTPDIPGTYQPPRRPTLPPPAAKKPVKSGKTAKEGKSG
jgi:hypothetical protein